MKRDVLAKGKVVAVNGNLIQVDFDGGLSQGETGYVELENAALKAEVLEINGNLARLQVFEDTKGLTFNQAIRFTGELLEAELGPGLLSRIYDGLENPLETLADLNGTYLPTGAEVEALDRAKKWDFKLVAKVGDELRRGDVIGSVREFRFDHKIMLPFKLMGIYKLTWVIDPGSYTVDTVIAKVTDEEGKEHEITMSQKWPIKKALIEGKKVLPKKILHTGQRIIDTLNPVMMGGTLCTPGPFGAGKTVLQHNLSKFSDAQIIVVIGCGERASELVEVLKTFPKLIDHNTNEPLMNRTIIIANTSSMPVAARESSVYVGMVIGEYYRQMGIDVLVLADSTSRWAQGMRELSGRMEEIPAEECFPASLQSVIAAYYQRSGVLEIKNNESSSLSGSITVCGAVSPSGGQWMVDPVTQATLKVVDGFLCLSAKYAGMRRYPSVDPIISYSNSLDTAAAVISQDIPEWRDWVRKSKELIIEGDEIGKRMEVVGLEGTTISDYVTYLKAELYSFTYLQQNAFEDEDKYCSFDQQKKQFSLLQKVFGLETPFETHDEAKTFYMGLQNDIRALNYMPYESKRYNEALSAIGTRLEELHATGALKT